jgi:hypothetical protein
VMRFLADENVSRLVVERIRAGGFDVASAGKRGRERRIKMSSIRQAAMTASSSRRIAILASWSFANG